MVLLTLTEVAQALRTSKVFAWRKVVQENAIPHVRMGRCVRVNAKDLEAYIEAQTVPARETTERVNDRGNIVALARK